MGDRIRSLQGARGVAALMVFAYHLLGFQGHAGPATWLVHRMWLGLTFFFVLSGFLLYRPFLSGRVRLGRYFASRALRIIPAYWFALLILLRAFPTQMPRRPLPNFLFLQLYGPSHNWIIVPAWTLCVEVSFYVALPLLAWWARGSALRIALLIPAGHLYALAATRLQLPYLTLGNYIDLFACGMLAAIAYESRREWSGRIPAGRTAIVLAMVGLALQPVGGREWSAVSNLVIAAAFAALTLMLASGRLRSFSSRPVVALGTISYGFYLWHFPIVQYISVPAPAPLAYLTNFVVLGIVTASLATFSWFVVERPALALLRGLRSHKPEELPAAA